MHALLDERDRRIINLLQSARKNPNLSIRNISEINQCSFNTAKNDLEFIKQYFNFIIEYDDNTHIQFRNLTAGNLDLISEQLVSQSLSVQLVGLLFFNPLKSYHYYASCLNISVSNFYRVAKDVKDLMPHYGITLLNDSLGYRLRIQIPSVAYPFLTQVAHAISYMNYPDLLPIKERLVDPHLLNYLFDSLVAHVIRVSKKTVVYFYWNMVLHYLNDATDRLDPATERIRLETHDWLVDSYILKQIENLQIFAPVHDESATLMRIQDAIESHLQSKTFNYKYILNLSRLFYACYEIFPFKYEVFERHVDLVDSYFQYQQDFKVTLETAFDATIQSFDPSLKNTFNQFMYFLLNENPVLPQSKTKRVLIAHSYSIRLAYTFSKRLEKEYPTHEFDYIEYHPVFKPLTIAMHEYDFIISTCDIREASTIPVIVVEDSFGYTDFERIRRLL